MAHRQLGEMQLLELAGEHTLRRESKGRSHHDENSNQLRASKGAMDGSRVLLVFYSIPEQANAGETENHTDQLEPFDDFAIDDVGHNGGVEWVCLEDDHQDRNWCKQEAVLECDKACMAS